MTKAPTTKEIKDTKTATAKDNAKKIEENGVTDENAKSLEDDGVYEPTNTDKITHTPSDQGTATGKKPSLNADGTRPAVTEE